MIWWPSSVRFPEGNSNCCGYDTIHSSRNEHGPLFFPASISVNFAASLICMYNPTTNRIVRQPIRNRAPSSHMTLNGETKQSHCCCLVSINNPFKKLNVSTVCRSSSIERIRSLKDENYWSGVAKADKKTIHLLSPKANPAVNQTFQCSITHNRSSRKVRVTL